jgi:hypothetical protein
VIDIGSGVAIGCFFLSGAGVVIAGMRRNGKNGNGAVDEKLCSARREKFEDRFDAIDRSLEGLHVKVNKLNSEDE